MSAPPPRPNGCAIEASYYPPKPEYRDCFNNQLSSKERLIGFTDHEWHMTIPWKDFTKEEVVFPKERFVIYEERDAEWAVPLGIAKVVEVQIGPMDEIDLEKFVGVKGKARQTFTELITHGRNAYPVIELRCTPIEKNPPEFVPDCVCTAY